ncbi:MAG: hypothetical protein ABIP48_03270 [Planctomycetota bacterium]
MTRQRLFPVVLVICLAMAAITPARAAEYVLDVIPGDAMGFLVVNRLAETDAKIQQTAQQMGLPAISPLTMFKTRDGIKGGVDEKRSAALVAMPAEDPGSKPAVLFVLPVSDFQKLIEPFEPDDPSATIVQVQGREGPALVAELKGYALATEPKHRQVLEKALNSQQPGADLALLRPWLAEQEIAGVLTTSGVQQACDKVLEGPQGRGLPQRPCPGDERRRLRKRAPRPERLVRPLVTRRSQDRLGGLRQRRQSLRP